MKLPQIEVKDRELLYLSIVLILTAIFTVFSMSLNFLDAFYRFFESYSRLRIAEFLINVIFLLLSGLLWFTYRYWREAAKKQKNLENVIDSISPDVLMVVDPDQNISMCNPSVKRMFGYEVNEVINQKTDFLYSNRQLEAKERNETFDLLVKEGFQVGWATGKKKNGNTMHLEIITGNLRDHGGAVLLLRDITRQNRMADELEKARVEQIETEQLKEMLELAISLSYDINNPLCIISGIAQIMLIRSGELDEEIVNQFKKIGQQTKRIEEIALQVTQIKSMIGTPRTDDTEKSVDAEREV